MCREAEEIGELVWNHKDTKRTRMVFHTKLRVLRDFVAKLAAG
jgi:hypothetical protein